MSRCRACRESISALAHNGPVRDPNAVGATRRGRCARIHASSAPTG